MSRSIRVERVGKYEWRIPKGTRPGMRVDGIVFADEYLLQKAREDLSLVQIANVACLPGILRASYGMPDLHQGYGFAIGGVAGFGVDGGVVSPGGVGYDINCLPPGSRVLLEFGVWLPIEEVGVGGCVVVSRGGFCGVSRVVYRFSRFEDRLYVVETRTGLVIRASGDHPILTDHGMVEASRIKPGMKVATHPFEGVRYEPVERLLILRESDFDKYTARELRRRGLLPLYSDNPLFPVIVKILGYFFGDGVFNGKKTYFYGSREGLEELRRDIEKLGYRVSRVITRKKSSVVNGREFTGIEHSIYVSAWSFRRLLEKLGAPIGKKTSSKFYIPEWLKHMPKWIKRLYLAAYFGAEMNKPQTINGYNFEQPFISLNKDKELMNNGLEFLRDIARLLKEFDIETLGVSHEDLGGKVRLKLRISTKPENLLKLWSRIGYIYCPERQRLALAATSWIRWKLKVLRIREKASLAAIALHGSGASSSTIVEEVGSKWVNRRFIERSIYKGVSKPRVPRNFPRFEEWASKSIDKDIVWDEVESVRVEPYNGIVYDITVEDDAHNFIANGVVVSNCGVRLLRTSLDEGDVRPRLRDLVYAMFRNVPSGVGSTGRVRLSISELNKVLDYGVEWAISRGFGWSSDPEHIEERGSWRAADSSMVSNRAKQRGHNQLGTLGAGNHFLEIQVVDKIYDPRVAKTLGVTHEGQVMVMIHTGSRGLGHQVASDYLLVMERAMRKYGIRPPDRELASLPFNTPEAQRYFKAMAAAANFAWTNRQLITHWVRESFKQVFHSDPDKFDLSIVYDVAHNIAKIEEHEHEGRRVKVIVHRKGATRAFPPEHPDIPKDYREIGQPVLIPGSMGTASYVMVGVKEGARTWYSAPHGAGRWMSRHAAIRSYSPVRVQEELARKGIMLRAATRRVIAEEAPGAYKDVDKVALVAHHVGIAKLVVRLRPIGVVKG